MRPIDPVQELCRSDGVPDRDSRAVGIRKAAEMNRKAAGDAYADLVPAVRTMKADGLSLRDMAAKLNAEGHTTRRGKPWNAMQVSRVLDRAHETA